MIIGMSSTTTVENDMKSKEQFKVTRIAKRVGSTILAGHLLVFLLVNKYSSWLRRHLLFSYFARWPLYADFNKCEDFGIKGVKNFYLKTKDNVKIGVWQILPRSLINEDGRVSEYFDECLKDGKPIVVYIHGNSGTRGSPHRIQLYQKFQQQEYHTITFDYRSFGDSSSVLPDEIGVVEDAKTVIGWVLERRKSSQVFIWGHSLGTGVSSRAIKELEENGQYFNGLILESPFNNLTDELKSYPLIAPLRHMLGFDFLIVKPILDSGNSFQSDKYLADCNVPILILHGEDDWIVPFKLGKKLHQYLLQNKKNANNTVRFVQFGVKNGGYGHKYICECQVLMDLVQSFVSGELDTIPSYVD